MNNTPETIYLIPNETPDDYYWCDDPAPDEHCDPTEAVGYTRNDVVEQLRARVAELEAHAVLIRKMAEKFPQEAAIVKLANNVLADKGTIDAFILRKQAEAVESYSEALKQWLRDMPGNPRALFVEGIKAACEQARRHANRLRAEAEKAGSDQ